MDRYQHHVDLVNRLVEIQNDIVGLIGSNNAVYMHLTDAEQALRKLCPDEPAPEIRMIYLQRAEGPGAGQALMVRTIAEADAILGVWAKSAPERGEGYDETDVAVTFDDGSETTLRVDLNCDTEDYLTANGTVYTLHITDDVCRLGREIWSGNEIYSQWALRRAYRDVKNTEFIRLVRHPAGRPEDAHILETTVSCDPLSMLKGAKLLATIDDRPVAHRIY